MDNETPNAGETPKAEALVPSNGDGKRTVSPIKAPWIRDNPKPKPGEDPNDPVVAEIIIAKTTMRIKKSSAEKAAKLKAYRRLGFTKKEWTINRLMAAEEFGNLMAEPLVARIMSVTSFDSMEQIDKAEKICGEILEKKDLREEIRLAAVNMMSGIVAARVKMQQHILELAGKARVGDIRAERTRTLPPVIPGSQVFAAAGSQVVIASSGQANGSSGQTDG